MKKVILLSFILLVGCGDKLHENISESMAEDTKQILEIMDDVIKEDRELTEKEQNIFKSYHEFYQSKMLEPESSVLKLTEEEKRLFLLTNDIAENPELFYTLESDKERYESWKERILNVMETGNIFGDD